MNKKILNKVSIITLIIGIFIFFVAYFFFHFVTDTGITLTWHEEGKPVVALLIGMLGILFIWTCVMALIASILAFKKEK